MLPPSRLPPDFSASAAYPLYAIDLSRGDAVALHFRPDDYRQASFLDGRALAHRRVDGWTLSLDALEAAFADAPTPRLQWLFHIGHCGSTLCSRLLDLVPGALGLREPLPLLTLSMAPAAPAVPRWRAVAAAALARGFADTDTVIVKPTSTVAVDASHWLASSTGNACLLWIDLNSWLAAMLRDDTLRQATLAAADSVDPTSHHGATSPTTDGERLAALWLARQRRWLLLSNSPALGSRLIDVDFDTVLDDPVRVISWLAEHFGLDAPPDLDARIAASGLLDVYAKDPRQAFDGASRQRELQAARRQFGAEIDAGVRWARGEIDAGGEGDALLARLGNGA